MAVGTKDLLNLSVLQRSEIGLSLQLLLCPARMLWKGCLLFSKTEYNFFLIRCSTTALRGSSLFYKFVQAPTVFVCSATPPADNGIEQCTLNDSVIKHAYHITIDIEGPEPSQEEEMTLAPPVHGFYVGRPLQFIIQHHPQVFAGLNSLSLLHQCRLTGMEF